MEIPKLLSTIIKNHATVLAAGDEELIGNKLPGEDVGVWFDTVIAHFAVTNLTTDLPMPFFLTEDEKDALITTFLTIEVKRFNNYYQTYIALLLIIGSYLLYLESEVKNTQNAERIKSKLQQFDINTGELYALLGLHLALLPEAIGNNLLAVFNE